MKKRILPSALVVMGQFLTSCAHNPPVEKHQVSNTLPVTKVEMREPTSEKGETPWTTWSEKGKVGGLLVLAHIRDGLLANNLHDPHVNYNYSSYKQVDCSKQNTNFRSADGTCNDINGPIVGAAVVAFGRNVPPEFIDSDAAEKLMTPNPAEVSKEFFTRDEFKPVPFLNMIAAVWIQFMNHDWLTHGKNEEKNPFKVSVEGGPDRIVERTKENHNDPSQYRNEFGKVTTNDVSHWWDASQIYGSSQEAQNTLRSFSNGRMKTVMVNGRELLPASSNYESNKQNQGLESTGFRDNWWLGLSMLHTLFVKEHNAIADMLVKKNVTFDEKNNKYIWTNGKFVKSFTKAELDEQVFQTARLINAAELAKIHTVEWTPAILPNGTLRVAMNANWYGASNPHTWSKFLSKIPLFNHTDWFEGTKSGYLIGGIVGDKTNNFGVPFSITEEFTSVYRLHSLLPETLNLKRMSKVNEVNALPFVESRSEKSYPIMANYDLKDLYYSFGTQHPGQLVLNNFPKFMQELAIPGHGNMDLGMVDVLRDRERGVPRYNQFRRAIGLKPISSYKDFFSNKAPLDARQLALIEKFNRVYGKDENGKDNVEMIDLLVGTLGEEVRPKSFGFGETQFQIFILMASRRLMADRFFTTSFN